VKKTTLKITVCPACGERFKITEVYAEDEDSLKYAVTKCCCSNYPIVDGIFFYRPGGYSRAEIKGLYLDEPDKALFTLLYRELYGQVCLFRKLSVLHKLDWVISKNRWRQLISGYINGNEDSVFNLIHHWGDQDWENYLKYRISSPTYQVLSHYLHSLSLSECRTPYIIDLCSGLGHFSSLVGCFFPNHRVINADFSFFNLYFSLKYVAPEADCVLLDANSQLPFMDHSFSFMVHVDSFHYIRNKRMLSKEMMRVVENNGIILLAHLHNSLANHISPGLPLSPGEYLELFSNREASLYDEEELFREVNRGSFVDMDHNGSDNNIDTIREMLLLIGSRNLFVDRKQSPVKSINPHRVKLSLNPLFRFERCRETLQLRRAFPSKKYQIEYKILVDFLPEEITINLKSNQTIDDQSVHREVEKRIIDYFNKGILVVSPELYFDSSWPSMGIPESSHDHSVVSL
jgi:SAM-dependent methyltransferase